MWRSIGWVAAATLLAVATLAPAGARALGQDPDRAARQAGEPTLGEILARQGYTIDTKSDEIEAQLFVKAGRGRVTHKPIAAFGLEKACSSGWYRPAGERPEKRPLWRVDERNNKRDLPPLMEGAVTEFDPGNEPFGLWVSTAGFADETVYTQDELQKFIARFKPNDRHKAHVYPVKRDGKVVPNAYVVGWEYSTNNDNQDIVTLLTNVRPAPAASK
jgi:hypothetical protein